MRCCEVEQGSHHANLNTRPTVKVTVIVPGSHCTVSSTSKSSLALPLIRLVVLAKSSCNPLLILELNDISIDIDDDNDLQILWECVSEAGLVGGRLRR